jgi:NADPH:quinone reductase-like Zn-dependent oxidoreductase
LKAIIVEKHGDPEGMALRDIERPAPGSRQVLVKVHACGVCRRDILIRRGKPQKGYAAPLVLGHEIAGGVREATGGRGADVTIDTVGGAVFHEIRRSMVPGGRIILVGEVTGQPVEIDIATIYRRGLRILSAVSTSRRQLEMALRMVAMGEVKPMVDRTMPLEQAIEAHRLVESNAVAGRIVLVP